MKTPSLLLSLVVGSFAALASSTAAMAELKALSINGGVEDGQRRLKLRSWQELFEQNTNLVATADGVTPLGGRTHEEVLQQQPEKYRRFRSTWAEIRREVTDLISQSGERFEGDIPIPKK